MTPCAYFLAAAIVLCAFFGLLLGSRILEGPEKRRRQFFGYYTNLSVAAMLVYHVLLLIPGPQRTALRGSLIQFSATLCILVTFLIYFFVLTRFGRHTRRDTMHSLGMRRLSNALEHYAVPLLTLLEWIFTADKTGITPLSSLIWLAVPAVYFLFILLRAAAGKTFVNTGTRWPYAFLDRERIGTAGWLLHLLLCMLFFAALGLLMSLAAYLLS